MSGASLARNAEVISAEIAWFRKILDGRFERHAAGAGGSFEEGAAPPPEAPPGSPYGDVVRAFDMTPAERVVLMLAYLPHIQPHALDPFFIQNRSLGRRFSEFGGVQSAVHGGFLPTCETAMFVLAGDDIGARLRHHALFRQTHWLYSRHVLRSTPRAAEEPILSAPLSLTEEYVERLTTGESYSPPFSAEFPAQRLSTAHEWADLVLDAPTREDVEDVVAWARHERTLLDDWQLSRRIKRGYRCLFHGPPGTGKTLTACLLGKATGMPVYRIDLSKVVSKYIGETEKNLASLFDHAEDRRWILFFDEADALFGKRTETRNANDRAANQQVAYLLQRIEDFPGIAILASNLKTHMDEAFARRFQSVVYFRMPGFDERLRLWEDSFRDKPYRLAEGVSLRRLAQDHEVSGGSIVNVLRFVCLRAVARDPQEITMQDLLTGVRRELHKEGKFST